MWFLDGDDIQILPGGIEMPKEKWDLRVEDFNLETGRAAGEGSAPSRKSFTSVAPIEDACVSRGFSYGVEFTRNSCVKEVLNIRFHFPYLLQRAFIWMRECLVLGGSVSIRRGISFGVLGHSMEMKPLGTIDSCWRLRFRSRYGARRD